MTDSRDCHEPDRAPARDRVDSRPAIPNKPVPPLIGPKAVIAFRTNAVAALAATLLLAALSTAVPSAAGEDEDYRPAVGQVGRDVDWFPTSPALIDKMF